MAAAPVLPKSSAPIPESAPLSEGARIVNTFIAPSKTFTDLRRNASWWGPFLLMLLVSLVFVYTAGQKIGFRKIMENQMQAQPKAQERLQERLLRSALSFGGDQPIERGLPADNAVGEFLDKTPVGGRN